MRGPSSVQIATAALVLILAAFVWVGHERAKRLKDELAAASRQGEFNAEATRQLDHYTHTTTIIREKAQEAEHEVRSSPGADQRLDPERRRALCAALERVRNAPACDEGAGDLP